MIGYRVTLVLYCLSILAVPKPVQAAGEKLYGVHWWEYAHPSVSSGPAGGWSVETIVTDSDPWWRGPYFVPLYETVATNYNAAIITRIDYNWGQTVPAPTTMPAGAWADKIINEVINSLGAYSNRWIIGNEPNLTNEATGWHDNKITPAGYAQIYHTVRQAIKSLRPADEVLFAPVSPGGVIGGVRWKAGNEWLAEAIDAALALPDGEIDGFAIHAYGNPFVSATQAVAEFRDTYVSQLAMIDSRGLHDVPVYLTEWNRATSNSGNLAANEQVSADFLRQSLLDVDVWNRTPGNHNIRAMAWFVNEGYGGWQEYSLKHWRNHGNPVGHPGDLWTALLESSHLPAGIVGTRPLPPPDPGIRATTEHAASDADLTIGYSQHDLLQNQIPATLAGDRGWHAANPASTNPADPNGLSAFTDGLGDLGSGLTGLLNDYPEGLPTKLISYDLGAAHDLSEIRIFTGNFGNDGRIYSTTAVYTSVDGSAYDLIGYFQSDPSGTQNNTSTPGGPLGATLVRIVREDGNWLAEGVRHLRFDFFAVSNLEGVMLDPFDGVNPFTGVDDGRSAAYVSPLVREIDVLGVASDLQPAGDFNADGAVNAADYVWWRKHSGLAAAYQQWRTNFGQLTNPSVADSGPHPVPEPLTGLVWLTSAMIYAFYRRPASRGGARSFRRPPRIATAHRTNDVRVPNVA